MYCKNSTVKLWGYQYISFIVDGQNTKKYEI